MSQVEKRKKAADRQRGNATAAMLAVVGIAASIGATFYSSNIKNKIDLQSRLNLRQDTHESMYSSLVILNRLFTHDASLATSLPAVYPVPYRGACAPGKPAEVEARARPQKAMWALNQGGRSVAITESMQKKTQIELQEWRCDPVFPSQIASVRVDLKTSNEKMADLKESALVTVATPPAPRCEIVMYSPVTARAGDTVNVSDVWGVLGLRVAGIAAEGEIGLVGAGRRRFPFGTNVANNVFDTRPHDVGVGVTANVTRGPMIFEGRVRAVDGTEVDCGRITVNGPAPAALTEEEKEAKKADLFLPQADPDYEDKKEEKEKALKEEDKKELADDALDAKDKAMQFPRLYGCFAAGSKILMADGRLKRIEAIGEGDLIWNPVLQKPVRVRRAYAGPETGYLREIVMDGQRLKVTSDHPFVIDGGVVAAADLEEGHLLPTAQGTWASATSVSWIPAEGDLMVYNLDLDAPEAIEEHLLMANGIVSGDWWLQMRLKDGSGR